VSEVWGNPQDRSNEVRQQAGSKEEGCGEEEMTPNNWLSNKTETYYYHKDNHKVIVAITPTIPRGRYQVFHSHPGVGGSSVPQELETALNMASARKKADKHMRHWNDSRKWRSDPDYGKKGLKGA